MAIGKPALFLEQVVERFGFGGASAEKAIEGLPCLVFFSLRRVLAGRGVRKLEFIAEIGPFTVAYPFRVRDFTLIVQRGIMETAILAAVQISRTLGAEFLHARLAFHAHPFASAFMASFHGYQTTVRGHTLSTHLFSAMNHAAQPRNFAVLTARKPAFFKDCVNGRHVKTVFERMHCEWPNTWIEQKADRDFIDIEPSAWF